MSELITLEEWRSDARTLWKEVCRLREERGQLMTERDAAKAEVERLREALKLCVETLALVECPEFVDPAIAAVVGELGRRVGYGNLMCSASALWRKSLEAQGLVGGEFVAGPCRVTVQNALTQGRAALAQPVKKV